MYYPPPHTHTCTHTYCSHTPLTCALTHAHTCTCTCMSSHSPTHIHTLQHNIEIEFSVWDMAGQEVYYATHQCFLSRNTLYLVVWNMEEKDKGIDYLRPWLLNIQVRTQLCLHVATCTYMYMYNYQLCIYMYEMSNVYTCTYKYMYTTKARQWCDITIHEGCIMHMSHNRGDRGIFI